MSVEGPSLPPGWKLFVLSDRISELLWTNHCCISYPFPQPDGLLGPAYPCFLGHSGYCGSIDDYLFVSGPLGHREPQLSLIERTIHSLELLDSELKGGTVCGFLSHLFCVRKNEMGVLLPEGLMFADFRTKLLFFLCIKLNW